MSLVEAHRLFLSGRWSVFSSRGAFGVGVGEHATAIADRSFDFAQDDG